MSNERNSAMMGGFASIRELVDVHQFPKDPIGVRLFSRGRVKVEDFFEWKKIKTTDQRELDLLDERGEDWFEPVPAEAKQALLRDLAGWWGYELLGYNHQAQTVTLRYAIREEQLFGHLSEKCLRVVRSFVRNCSVHPEVNTCLRDGEVVATTLVRPVGFLFE